MQPTKQVRRPRKLKIGKRSYKIVSKNKAWDNNRSYGEFNYADKVIKISEDQTKSELAQEDKNRNYLDTVIHEILHGIISEYETCLDRRKEEKFVSDLASGLTDVLVKNPKLVDWIRSRIELELKKPID